MSTVNINQAISLKLLSNKKGIIDRHNTAESQKQY